ncbi:MAG: Regulator of nucleoside diphosphate kinase [Bacteroidota bacterium]|jgi:regulator of nucleoside diphosphate kinase|nr:Regulator of nucleoside diphosphate kinase [Bacteroidota bacterium]
MKPIFSESVYKILYTLVTQQKSTDVKQLGAELLNGVVVDDKAFKKDIVSLNSIVQFIDESISQPIQIQIVLPEEMDLKKRKISILAPISIALIGFKEGERFTRQMPHGTKKFQIIKVINE